MCYGVCENGEYSWADRPLPSSKNPHFQDEARCTTFLVKMSFICMRKKNDFHIKGPSTYSRFETEARGNLEVAYLSTWHFTQPNANERAWL